MVEVSFPSENFVKGEEVAIISRKCIMRAGLTIGSLRTARCFTKHGQRIKVAIS